MDIIIIISSSSIQPLG